MEHSDAAGSALTIALALAAGMVAQSVARHLRIPGIVVLLLAGVLLGPEVSGLINPDAVRPAMQALVGFAVGVILFEGGLNLDIQRLRRQARVIQMLITVGAIVTAIGGTLAARAILGWDWRISMLFGTLMIVTGPTVITPILRRTKVQRNLQTILEAEGVFIDAVGAILAILAVQVALQPSGANFTAGLAGVAGRLAFGTFCGFLGGGVVALLLRSHRLVPEGFENILVLSLVLVLFQASNRVLSESGIAAVTVMGVFVGNAQARGLREMREFKEQLTILFIGLLFVLLAADVHLADIRSLGWNGVWVVVALILVVRPANIFVSTLGSGLKPREKMFLAWLAPRGIVAAAVASLFAQSLESAGIPGGDDLRAIVFLVIATTVLLQGLTGGWVAQLLHVRRPSNIGYAILGANDLGRAIGRSLAAERKEVTILDLDADLIHQAEQDGFSVIFGNAIDESILFRAQVDAKAGCLGVTTNEEINYLFGQRVREEFRAPKTYIALQSNHASVKSGMIHHAGATVLFGREVDIEMWDVRCRRNIVECERWRLNETTGASGKGILDEDFPDLLLLPMVRFRDNRPSPFDDRTDLKRGDELVFAVLQEKRDEAVRYLTGRGWIPVNPSPPPA